MLGSLSCKRMKAAVAFTASAWTGGFAESASDDVNMALIIPRCCCCWFPKTPGTKLLTKHTHESFKLWLQQRNFSNHLYSWSQCQYIWNMSKPYLFLFSSIPLSESLDSVNKWLWQTSCTQCPMQIISTFLIFSYSSTLLNCHNFLSYISSPHKNAGLTHSHTLILSFMWLSSSPKCTACACLSHFLWLSQMTLYL